MKRLFCTLALTVSMNMVGILLVTRTGGIGAVLLIAAAALFFLYVNILPPAGRAGGAHADTQRLRQPGRGCTLILYTWLTFLPGLVWWTWSFHVMSDWTAGRILLYILSVLLWMCGEGILLLNGCLRLMVTSMQMGIIW